MYTVGGGQQLQQQHQYQQQQHQQMAQQNFHNVSGGVVFHSQQGNEQQHQGLYQQNAMGTQQAQNVQQAGAHRPQQQQQQHFQVCPLLVFCRD